MARLGTQSDRAVAHADPEQRCEQRVVMALAGRLTWRGTDGSRRTARIRTRDLSQTGVFVECVSGCGPIPLYRLVDLRLDETARARDDVPALFRRPRVTAAVYRIGPARPSTGLPDGYALRLLVKPSRRRRPSAVSTHR